MKKGFTLIELMAVIIILSLVVLIAFPNIVNVVKNSNNSIDSATSSLIINGAKNYVDEHKNSYPLKNGKVYCLQIESLIMNDYVINDDKVKTFKYVEVSVLDNLKYTYEVVDSCIEKR